MKNLTQFEVFNIDEFLNGKLLLFIAEKDYQKYENGEPVGREGIKAELIIMKDDTVYKDGKTQDNLYEKLFVKVPTSKSTLGLTLNQPVKLINVLKASVYGKYRSDLSLTAENIIPLEKGQRNG